jgi:hypothetical protein
MNNEERAALVARLRAVIDTAVGDSMSLDNQMSVTNADSDRANEEQSEAESVRDAVIAQIESDGRKLARLGRLEAQQGWDPTWARVRAILEGGDDEQ